MKIEKVTTDSGTYTVYVDGDDPRLPYAVFLHGGPGFHSYGERNLLGGRFRSQANFLWFDHLGCGEFQAAPGCVLSWDRQIDDIVRIIRHFTRDPVHLVGHCAGTEIIHDLMRLDGAIARSVMWLSPVRSLGPALQHVIRRCISEGRLGTRALTGETTARLDRFLSLPEVDLGADEALLILQLATASRDFHRLYWVDTQAMDRWLAWMAERPFSPEAFLQLTSQFFERGVLPPPDYRGIPVQVLYSNEDPVTLWEMHGRQLLNHIPHATATEVGGGHWLQFEKPQECVRSTLEFWTRNT